MGWFDDNHYAGEAHNFGMGYMYGGGGYGGGGGGGGGGGMFGGEWGNAGSRKCSVCRQVRLFGGSLMGVRRP